MNKFHKIIIIIVSVLIVLLIYNRLAFLNVVVKFDNLEPFEKQMNVYFKGFKIGKTTKIYPDKEYKNTYLKLRLYAAKVNFPSNITVDIKKKKAGGYVSVIYPDDPSLVKLKNNDVIKGKISKDLNTLFEGKFSDEDVDVIVDDAANLMESANEAINNLSDIFVELKGILQDNRNNIKLATCNLADTTTNLKKMSESLNATVGGESVSSSVNNIEQTTENIQNITKNLDDITKQIDNTTVPVINGVLIKTGCTVQNVEEITGGIKNTLKKHMGFGRLLFGKPISNDECKD